MKGNSKALLKFMEGSDKRFVIPVYQRNYDWKKDNCEQLFNDLLDVVQTGRPSHFFGSIVASTEGDDYIVIDGQQRLTTVSLLLLALMDLINEGKVEHTSAQLADKIKEDYLIDKWQPEERKIKLKPVKNDMKAFNSLFSPADDRIPDSNVTQNYLFFYDAIQSSGVLADDLFDAVKKLIVIDITLEDGDDPQLIFESLNSTGLDLSEADKVRNYVLMGLEQKLQERLYESYWNKIEELTEYQVSEFIRQYLTLKLGKWPNINDVYRTFKRVAPSSGAGMEPLLADMLAHARFYSQITNASVGIRSIDSVLKRLSLLEMTVVNPFLFALLERLQAGKIDEDGMNRVLGAIESYLFRRLVCEVPTNALNKVFATLNNDALKITEDESDYADAVVYVLERKTAAGRFPNDQEFEERVRTRDFYNMRPKNKVYCFNRLENGDSYETVNVPELMLAKEHGLSVEHVMPQTLTEAWKKDLGPDYTQIHATWKNRIANLTLTAYNPQYSNRPFREKLTMKDGFRDSPLPLNKWIAQQEKWTLDELEARSDVMAERFVELWPYPEVDFTPKVATGSQYSLDDDFDFTGTRIVSYTFMGTKYYVSTWKDAVEGILRQICELYPADMHRIAAQKEFPGTFISAMGESRAGWTNIGQDLYAYLATSTASKMRVLEAVFAKTGTDKDDLCFEIRQEADGE